MICKVILIAGTLNSPQGMYYAESCWVKTVSFPIVTQACVAEFPERAKDFTDAQEFWQRTNAEALTRSREFLESKHYDFEGMMVQGARRMANSWISSEKEENGRKAAEELCDAHISEMRS